METIAFNQVLRVMVEFSSSTKGDARLFLERRVKSNMQAHGFKTSDDALRHIVAEDKNLSSRLTL